jgi:hypothetical protein
MAFDIANPIGTGTDAELLEFTRAAIAQVTLHGQWYATGYGRSLTRADLPDLIAQAKWLEGKIANAANTGGSKVNYAVRGRVL